MSISTRLRSLTYDSDTTVVNFSNTGYTYVYICSKNKIEVTCLHMITKNIWKYCNMNYISL